MTGGAPLYESLKAKSEALNKISPFSHRLRRSLSWIERANSENGADAKFIFLWVAFNAAYAVDRKAEERKWRRGLHEWERRENYLKTLSRLSYKHIHFIITEKLSNPVDDLMENAYVFRGFWESLDDEPFNWENWRCKQQFESEHDEVRRRFGISSDENTTYILKKLFDRLYVLRNQLMHGCATQNGSLNRRQVETGSEILALLVPLFLDMMLDHPEEDWGRISYPVRDDIREDRAERHLHVDGARHAGRYSWDRRRR